MSAPRTKKTTKCKPSRKPSRTETLTATAAFEAGKPTKRTATLKASTKNTKAPRKRGSPKTPTTPKEESPPKLRTYELGILLKAPYEKPLVTTRGTSEYNSAVRLHRKGYLERNSMRTTGGEFRVTPKGSEALRFYLRHHHR